MVRRPHVLQSGVVVDHFLWWGPITINHLVLINEREKNLKKEKSAESDP